MSCAELQNGFDYCSFSFFIFLNIYLSKHSWSPWKNAREHTSVGGGPICTGTLPTDMWGLIWSYNKAARKPVSGDQSLQLFTSYLFSHIPVIITSFSPSSQVSHIDRISEGKLLRYWIVSYFKLQYAAHLNTDSISWACVFSRSLK